MVLKVLRTVDHSITNQHVIQQNIKSMLHQSSGGGDKIGHSDVPDLLDHSQNPVIIYLSGPFGGLGQLNCRL